MVSSGMKTIECTTDSNTIKDIIKEYYHIVTYDGSPGFEDFVPDTESALWFKLLQDSDTAGLIKLENVNWVTWTPHIVIKEEYRGSGSEEWGKLVYKYMKERIPDVTFLVITPYWSAKNYAKRMGFTELGIIPRSIKKNGELMDQYILGGEIS